MRFSSAGVMGITALRLDARGIEQSVAESRGRARQEEGRRA